MRMNFPWEKMRNKVNTTLNKNIQKQKPYQTEKCIIKKSLTSQVSFHDVHIANATIIMPSLFNDVKGKKKLEINVFKIIQNIKGTKKN